MAMVTSWDSALLPINDEIVWIREQFLEKSTQDGRTPDNNLPVVPAMTSAMDGYPLSIPFPLWRESETAIPVCSQANTDHLRMRRLRISVKVARAR